jgi:hypothetical protein
MTTTNGYVHPTPVAVLRSWSRALPPAQTHRSVSLVGAAPPEKHHHSTLNDVAPLEWERPFEQAS